MSEIVLKCQVTRGINTLWWGVIVSNVDYEEKIKPHLRKVVRSRGRHDPGSGNYCYGAQTVKDLSITGTPGLYYIFPGINQTWDSGGWRYQVSWRSDGMLFFLAGYSDGSRWHYSQCTPGQVHTYRNGGKWITHLSVKYRVPDSFSSAEWIDVNEFPWANNSGNQYIGAYAQDLTIQFTDPRVDTAEFSFMDRLTLAYEPWIQVGISQAYVDAVSRLPINRTNNVANFISVLSAIKSLAEAPYLSVTSTGKVLENASDVTREVKDAWLKYRYLYSTSVMDISEVSEYAMRVARVKEGCKSHGIFTCENSEGTFLFKCSLHVDPDDLSSIQSDMGELGMELSAYNAWDLVPYSFIADWFFRIGDRLEFYEDRNRALKLKPRRVWFSVVKQIESEVASEDYYFRWEQDAPQISPTFVKDGGPKQSTIIKRAVDVFALAK